MMEPCEYCGGDGEVEVIFNDGQQDHTNIGQCPYCEGSGDQTVTDRVLAEEAAWHEQRQLEDSLWWQAQRETEEVA